MKIDLRCLYICSDISPLLMQYGDISYIIHHHHRHDDINNVVERL